MRKLRYSMGVSLDGYIAGPGGDIDWGVPSKELHSFHNEETGALGAHLLGRRLYEVMLIWETADDSRWEADHEREFARIWKELPKVVFSRTLEKVEGNARLVKENVVDEVARLKEQPGRDLAVGGATLAATLTKAGLIDEYGLFVNPAVIGAGTRFFEGVERKIDLELVGSRTFGDVVYLRYGRNQG